MTKYRRFEAWRRCHALTLAIHDVTAAFPVHERYGLTQQARRAAFSAAANIAEGSAKRGPREFRRFLDISLGSLAEFSYRLDLAADLKLVSPEREMEARALHTQASQVTWKLYASMSRPSTR